MARRIPFGSGNPHLPLSRRANRKNPSLVSQIFVSLYFASARQYLWTVLTALDQWFAAEILPHEGVLMRYLIRLWRNSAEVPDLRQDIYVRVYESARRALPASPKAFLFATARNLMTDRIRRSRVVSIDSTQDFEGLDVLIDEVTPERRVGARQELRSLARAFDSLSEKCRNVIWLRRVEGLSQRETAQRLGIHEGAVESQLARGVRILALAVFGSAVSGSAPREKEKSRHESKHE
jgi:RNA polymerase sigma factor (sigma-70 family)